MMTTTTVDQVSRYADQVRAALRPLSTEEIEDLTDGLEADLAEALSEAGPDADPTVVFGTAGEYARELRQAAEVPGVDLPTFSEADVRREVKRRRREAKALRRKERWAARRDTWEAWLAKPAVVRARAFGKELAPAWWITRGALPGVAWLFMTSYIHNKVHPLFSAVLVIIGVVLSVQWGRGHWLVSKPQRLAQKIWAVAAIICIPFAVGGLGSTLMNARSGPPAYAYDYDYATQATPRNQITANGHDVTDLFVYGPDGALIPDARVFDQGGRPVVTSEWDYSGTESVIYLNGNDGWGQLAPPRNQLGWFQPNTYPQHVVPTDETGQPAGAVTTRTAPFSSVDPLEGYAPAAPTASAGATPGASASPVPEASASPAPDAGGSPAPEASGAPSMDAGAAAAEATPAPDAAASSAG